MSIDQQATRITSSSLGAGWFKEQFAHFTPGDIVLVLLFALLTGCVITIVYKKTYKGVLYNPSFAITLILLTMITSSVVMAIGSSVALSMGMVGALSIVRFRTAVKDPIDTAYMFWAITMGIFIGSRYFLPAVIVTIGIAIVMLLISFVRFRKMNSYLLVVHFDPIAEQAVRQGIRAKHANFHIRSQTTTRAGSELTAEITLPEVNNLVAEMLDINGVYDATLVSCKNESAF